MANAVDWGFAGQIGGFGFGLVFVVLIILAVVIWAVGLAVKRAAAGKSGAATGQGEAAPSKTEAVEPKKGD